jgi:hypothetical protein
MLLHDVFVRQQPCRERVVAIDGTDTQVTATKLPVNHHLHPSLPTEKV